MKLHLIPALMIPAVACSLTISTEHAFAGDGQRMARQENRPPQGQPPPRAPQPDRGAAEAQQRAMEDARRNQEQAVRQQEEQARKSQQDAMRQQQDAMRQQQQSAREQQRESQRAQDQSRQQQAQQQEQQRRAQEDAAKQQEQAQRSAERAQQQQQQQQQEQAQRAAERTQQEQAQRAAERTQQDQAQRAAERTQQEQVQRAAEHTQQEQAREAARAAEIGSPGAVHEGRHIASFTRPLQAPAFNGSTMPLNKALSMPQFDANLSAAEMQHAQQVVQSMNQHLIAVPQIPGNFTALQSMAYNNYLNNYQVMLNNQQLMINRQNSFFSAVPSYEYPYWWQPKPGWVFSNGFTLANSINVGLDWLRWGWHPYYGPPPEGFICSSNYVPTPWIYFPQYGLWREAGVMGWAPSGPPFGYGSLISVEVIESRHVHVQDNFTGWNNQRVVNVPVLYNAFYDPSMERWGYTNRHGNFIWLNM